MEALEGGEATCSTSGGVVGRAVEIDFLSLRIKQFFQGFFHTIENLRL